MALHMRNQVRNALVTRLTGLATTGASVYKSRVFPLDDSILPALCVYTNTERSENLSIGYPRAQRRTLSVYVEALGKSTSAMDDLLDQIAREVEIAIASDPTLGGVCFDCCITDTEFTLIDGDKNVGCARMTYQALYNVKETVPDAVL